MVRTRTPAAGHLYVVRHADAGVRRPGPDDQLRPLNPFGRARAGVLANLLEPVAVGDIVSSTHPRCVETLAPLAAHRGCAVSHGDRLSHLSGVVVDARRDHRRPISSDQGGVWVVSRHDGSLLLVDEIRAARSSGDNGSHGTPPGGEVIVVRETSSSDRSKES